MAYVNAENSSEEGDDLLQNYSGRTIQSAKSIGILTEQAKPTPLKYKGVWQRAKFRLKFRKALNTLNDDILIYGTTNEVYDLNKYEIVMEKREQKRKVTMFKQDIPWYIIRPNHPFKRIWSVILVLMLIYTATLMPYRIAFEEQIMFDAFTITEIIIDLTFCIDILINLFSGYRRGNGEVECRMRKIAIPYLKTWFVPDLFGSFPFSLVQYAMTGSSTSGAGRANNFARVARLPRIYKIVSVARFSKASRMYKGHKFIEKLKDYFHVNNRVFRLLKLLLSILIVIHFIACFWYFAARLDDFPYDCWIVQGGFMDKSIGSKYLTSFYWAFTTVSTVGYGDIHANNDTEMIMAVFCMMIGVGFYSMVVSSITSLMSSIDDAQLELSNKLIAATSFGKETGLEKKTLYKVRQMLKYNYKQSSIDNNTIFEELPNTLKYEIAMSMHNGIAQSIALFLGKDHGFIISVMTILKPIAVSSQEVLYREGSLPDEFYVIMTGRINLVLQEYNFPYKTFLKGSYVGEYEIIHRLLRVTTVTAACNSELLVMTKQQLNQLLKDFPYEAEQFKAQAKERYERCCKAMLDAKALLRSKSLAVKDEVVETEINEDEIKP
mmetsp:Transcript_10690/g.20799  ORF Transcript_10690/g.20799 Transcript_10690/m.20799 type:complete len:606 (+) Transcript_10690:25-1842(+)